LFLTWLAPVVPPLAAVPQDSVLIQMVEQAAEMAAEKAASATFRALQPILDKACRDRWRLLDPWRESNRSADEQEAFKTAVLEFYHCSSPEKVRDKPMAVCMVSQRVFPKPLVIASHIWKYASQGFGLDEFGLKLADLNSVRNGLCLASEIEAAFDRKLVTFSYNLMKDKFKFHVLDSRLLDEPIHDWKNEKTASVLFSYYGEQKAKDSKGTCADSAEPEVDGSAESTPLPKPKRSAVDEIVCHFPTFRDLDNTEMPWSAPAMPFRRLLAWHYVVATTAARRCSWFKPGYSRPESAIGDSDWSKRSPGVMWPTNDVLDLFDHAASKSERDEYEAAAGSDVVEA